MNQLIVYIIATIIAGLGGLSGLYFSLRGQSTRLEHRLTKSETRLDDLTDRMDRDLARIEKSLSDQLEILRQISEKIKK